MTGLWNSALALLVVTGGLLGLTLPFARIATDAGVPALIWSFVISAGAGGVLLAALLASGGRMGLDGTRLRYFAVVAAISYAIPNFLMFSAIPHLGAGYTGVMFTLTPILTLIMSIGTGVQRPNALGVAGITVGFAGALLVATTRGEVGRPADLVWVAVGLAIPVFLAAGNVYRSWGWPRGAGTIELAAGSHLASAVMTLALLLALGQGGAFALLPGMPWLVAAQVAAAAGMFAFFFRLQAVGGPVYLSQIGYVAAAVGLFSGTVFLGERYSLLTWAGALIVTAGVLMTSKAQAQASKA
ncbi:MAG: DMT family transporter [Rhizobiaceae bacterium]|nr:DMT family transporter [Rhizobiaceae bacterium]MCV0408345.1 DMT family transporter [Rhizobiaceae bacterium]